MVKERNYRATSCFLPLRLWIGKKLFGAVGPHGVRVSPSRMIKGSCQAPELADSEYVAEHTSIPVPKVFSSHYYDDSLYIEMEYVCGMSLEEAWYRGHLTQDQKKHTITQVAGYISQLRELKPPREASARPWITESDVLPLVLSRVMKGSTHTFGPTFRLRTATKY